jgi:hypothetical protein
MSRERGGFRRDSLLIPFYRFADRETLGTHETDLVKLVGLMPLLLL